MAWSRESWTPGLVMDLGCAAKVLARTTLRADPACLLVPRGTVLGERERSPRRAAGPARALPSLRQDLFAPLWDSCARAGFAPDAEVGPSFYQAYYLVQEQLCTCLTRYEPGARRELDPGTGTSCWKTCPHSVSRWYSARDHSSAYIDLLRSYLMEVLGGAASLPPRRGRPAKPFYNFPVLSSTAPAAAAPVHPDPAPPCLLRADTTSGSWAAMRPTRASTSNGGRSTAASPRPA